MTEPGLPEITDELRALGLRHMEKWLAELGSTEDLGLEAPAGLCLQCGAEGRRYVIEGPRCCVAVCRTCARSRRRAAVKAGLPPTAAGLNQAAA